MKFWIAVGGLVLALSGPAQGATVIRPGSDTSLPYADWIAQARAPTPDVQVWVWRDDCPAPHGFSCTNGRTIWLHPAEYRPWAFLHELGHVYDRHVMEPGDRRAYRELTGLRGRWWAWAADGNYFALQEEFANDYADCALGSTESVCELIRAFST